MTYDNELSQHIKPKKGLNGNWLSGSGVSLSFVRDLSRRYRETGTVEPKPHGGGAVAKLGTSELPVVKALVQAQPDALLEELCERFAHKTGVNVSISTMGRAVESLKLTVKKKL